MCRFISSKFINELDSYYAKEDLRGALAYLTQCREDCVRGGDLPSLLTVLNEFTGLYRQTKQEAEGMQCIADCEELLEKVKPGAKTEGTILLNCATTMKSFGKADEAMRLYEKAENLLTAVLHENDPLLAGLYNNMALALQDTGNREKAEEYFLRALGITGKSREQALEYAITCVNLAHLRFEKDYHDESVNTLLDSAMDILSNDEFYNFDKYAFTCRKCAPSYGYFGRFADEKYLNERADKKYAGN